MVEVDPKPSDGRRDLLTLRVDGVRDCDVVIPLMDADCWKVSCLCPRENLDLGFREVELDAVRVVAAS